MDHTVFIFYSVYVCYEVYLSPYVSLCTLCTVVTIKLFVHPRSEQCKQHDSTIERSLRYRQCNKPDVFLFSEHQNNPLASTWGV